MGQSLVSSQMTSSHITVPLSHTQIWHGSGFHTSRSANTWPSKVQLLLIRSSSPCALTRSTTALSSSASRISTKLNMSRCH